HCPRYRRKSSNDRSLKDQRWRPYLFRDRHPPLPRRQQQRQRRRAQAHLPPAILRPAPALALTAWTSPTGAQAIPRTPTATWARPTISRPSIPRSVFFARLTACAWPPSLSTPSLMATSATSATPTIS